MTRIEYLPLPEELRSTAYASSVTFSEQKEAAQQRSRKEQIKARRKAGKWNCCEIVIGEDGQPHQCSRVISANAVLCADHKRQREARVQNRGVLLRSDAVTPAAPHSAA